MTDIKIMVNGLPGNMAYKVAEHADRDNRFELVAYAMTGPEITADYQEMPSGKKIRLIRPDGRDKVIGDVIKENAPFISVDYSHPSAVNDNAEFYCRRGLPFVMGTTGGERKKLEDTVNNGAIAAVIAPNMAKQIVGFQAMMEHASEAFPNLFKGYSLEIRESHQDGKADTSGTAKAMVRYFNSLGMPFEEKDIEKERDPEVQENAWNIPGEYLDGHGWHTYTLTSEDGTVQFDFSHNVNGRDVYARGTLDAVFFLNDRISQGKKGVFTMIDVLKGS